MGFECLVVLWCDYFDIWIECIVGEFELDLIVVFVSCVVGYGICVGFFGDFD